jgi:hypothetical protein
VPGNYHKPSTTISFADSHVELHRWTDPRTLYPPKTLAWHDHDYPVAGSRDVAWLQTKTSSRK